MLSIMMFTSGMLVLVNNWMVVHFVLSMLSFFMFLKLSGEYWLNFWVSGLGLDNISFGLVFLSVWIVMLVLMASRSMNKSQMFISMFLVMNLILLLILELVFSCMDLLWFYVMFEASLIPMIFMILGWGYQPERVQAGIYMLFYTFFASLPLLVSLFYYSGVEGGLSMKFIYLNFSGMSFMMNIWYLGGVMAFFVKMPMFISHLWLPKAHVEAPVGGSMILAGVLLKLGGYGLMNMFILFEFVHLMYVNLWLTFGLLGGLIMSLVCLCQIDMKALIAYSSVCHMGLVLGGLSVMSLWGFSGGLMLMIGHGLCSSGLFCIANMSYERIGSRSLLLNKGMLSIVPGLALWWFLLSVNNMSAPPSLNLLGELKLIMSFMSWSYILILILFLLCFFSGAYSLYMYSMSQHGKMYNYIYSFNSGYVLEFLILLFHWIPLNILFLKSELMMLS